MPLFLLIRHGETDYVKKGRLSGRQPGIHLNKKGKAQAEALVEKLTGAPINFSTSASAWAFPFLFRWMPGCRPDRRPFLT